MLIYAGCNHIYYFQWYGHNSKTIVDMNLKFSQKTQLVVMIVLSRENFNIFFQMEIK